MLGLILVLVITVAALLVPRTRRAALSVLGVTAIAVLAIAGIWLPVWALYEAKSWLAAPEPLIVESRSKTAEQGTSRAASAEDGEAPSADERAEQETNHKEQQQQAQEQQRVASVAEAARAIVDSDRKYAAAAAASPSIPGLARVSADLIAIRVPSWRDPELAVREQGLIRAWLHSIGLTPEQTSSLYTANGWGSVYDLWRSEVLADAEAPAPVLQPAEAPAAGRPGPAAEEPVPRRATAPRRAERPSVIESEVPFEPIPEPPPERRPAQPRPRTETPKRQPAQESEVGPFGF